MQKIIKNRLWVNTNYSFLESGIKIHDLIAFGIKKKWKWLSIADKNNTIGLFKFWFLCIENNIKPILGIEINKNNVRILIIAKNNQGVKDIFFYSSMVNNRDEKFTEQKILIDNFSNDCLYFSQNSKLQNDENIFNIDKLFLSPIKYFTNAQYKSYIIMKNIKEGKKLDLGDYSKLFTNNEIIIEKDSKWVDGIVQDIYYDINDFYENHSDGRKENEELNELIHNGLVQRFKNKDIPSNYLSRLKQEYEVIIKMGFADYILKVFDYVQYAKNNNILVGPGRGSAAGSLLCYSLFITNIDPVKYDLLFERFLNPHRSDYPDIDIDFEDNKRKNIIEYIIQKYGKKHSGQIITIQKFGLKNAIRFILKTIKSDVITIDFINKHIKELFSFDNLLSAMPFSEAKSPELKKFLQSKLVTKYLSNIYPNHTIWKFVFENIITVLNFPKNYGTHAAGIIISNNDIEKKLGTISINNQNIIEKDMNDLEKLGYLKNDVLGLINLTIIKETIVLINSHIKNKITISSIPLDNINTFNLLTSGATEGIFQLESPGITKVIKRMNINSFDDIVAVISLFRPGPMQYIAKYIQNKRNPESIFYLNSEFKNITQKTFGIIIYQEQVMRLVKNIAGFSLIDADLLRAAIAKKKIIDVDNMKQEFINGCQQNNYSKIDSIKMFDYISRFSGYGFNKSHAVSYATITYWTAYLKANYLLYFSVNYLSRIKFSKIQLTNYIDYLALKKINIIDPQIIFSSSDFKIFKNSLIAPLSIIDGIGPETCNNIVQIRNKHSFSNERIAFFYLCKIVGKSIFTKLIDAGCFDCYNLDREDLSNNIDNIYIWADLNMINKPFIDLKSLNRENLSKKIINKKNKLILYY